MINALNKIRCKQQYDRGRGLKSKKAATFAPCGRKAMLAAGLVASLTTRTAHSAATNICELENWQYGYMDCISYVNGISESEKTDSQITSFCSDEYDYFSMRYLDPNPGIKTLLIIADHRNSQVGDGRDAELFW